ncbi:zinc dependent phospholipase C family protein [Vulgatibacter incomptus]|uniref:Phospholipase C/D domain-containing protein n=1 Tax=Vulgatibacter incomptus TaxID=1391653 RepID=A0A0K1PE09_9BACT|nr:zinc dependent phospholipase C family protein [Vulgatibacter incomptus]AKU91661.1 hypothetical protein AKJ08_2048 [Vulgatibacter incomptus]
MKGFSVVLSFGVLLVLWPRDAWAWGPLTHLDFSGGALSQLGVLPSAMRILLAKCADDFLYGSLAADIIVGKNLARYAVHCHNWKVGWQVLDKARGEPQQAFALGFLAHLAADTVAHNYYVPYKTVQGHAFRRTGHAYWELRFDQKLGPDLWQTARRITRPSFRAHDEFLEDALAGSAVIPFGVSKRLFNQLLLAARMRKYQSMAAVVAAENEELPLTDEEVRTARALAVEQILGMLADGERCRAAGADPTGGRNLHFALGLRQNLREGSRKGEISANDAAEVVRRTRPAFHAAIHGKLELPDLPSRAGSVARDLVRDSAEQTDQATPEELETEDEAA